jgi:hypothetical protein
MYDLYQRIKYWGCIELSFQLMRHFQLTGTLETGTRSKQSKTCGRKPRSELISKDTAFTLTASRSRRSLRVPGKLRHAVRRASSRRFHCAETLSGDVSDLRRVRSA